MVTFAQSSLPVRRKLTLSGLVVAVFLDKENNLKLGDFGLSKAMEQASMTQTYVGVSNLIACDDSF